MGKKKSAASSEMVAKIVKQAIGKPDSEEVYQFKIELDGAHLPIWRTIQTFDCDLEDFHDQIQGAMGWENCHMHQFHVGKVLYLPTSPDGMDFDFGFGRGPKIEDSTRMKLSTLLEGHRKGFKFKYEYDFGDGWMHLVTYEGRVPAESGARYPRCIDGKNACPPEDIGGIWGYAERMQILEDPDDPEHEELREWMGNFDPHKFNLKDANSRMPRHRR